MLLAASHTTSEVRYLSTDDPLGRVSADCAAREDNHEYYVVHHPNFATAGASSTPSDVFLIRTNSDGRTFRLVSAPVSAAQRSNWQELIRNRPAVMLSAAHSFRSHLVLFEREDGLPFLRVIPLAEPSQNLLAASYRIEFNEPAYNAAPGMNPEFEQAHFRYSYESFITPRSIFDFDVSNRQSTLRKQQPVLGGYDATLYASERSPLDRAGQIRASQSDRLSKRHATGRQRSATSLRLRQLRRIPAAGQLQFESFEPARSRG